MSGTADHVLVAQRDTQRAGISLAGHAHSAGTVASSSARAGIRRCICGHSADMHTFGICHHARYCHCREWRETYSRANSDTARALLIRSLARLTSAGAKSLVWLTNDPGLARVGDR